MSTAWICEGRAPFGAVGGDFTCSKISMFRRHATPGRQVYSLRIERTGTSVRSLGTQVDESKQTDSQQPRISCMALARSANFRDLTTTSIPIKPAIPDPTYRFDRSESTRFYTNRLRIQSPHNGPETTRLRGREIGYQPTTTSPPEAPRQTAE